MLHNNKARTHRALETLERILEQWELLEHPFYSPDVGLNDVHQLVH
jgi:hypothetical protein